MQREIVRILYELKKLRIPEENDKGVIAIQEIKDKNLLAGSDLSFLVTAFSMDECGFDPGSPTNWESACEKLIAKYRADIPARTFTKTTL